VIPGGRFSLLFGAKKPVLRYHYSFTTADVPAGFSRPALTCYVSIRPGLSKKIPDQSG
jgi:hypothetical protein